MVIGNFERELVDWSPQRLLTEWIITVNAILATLLVLTVPREREVAGIIQAPESFSPLYRQAWIRAALAVAVLSVIFLVTNRLLYHYPANEKPDKALHTRFGVEADWRAKPNLKNAQHK